MQHNLPSSHSNHFDRPSSHTIPQTHPLNDFFGRTYSSRAITSAALPLHPILHLTPRTDSHHTARRPRRNPLRLHPSILYPSVSIRITTDTATNSPISPNPLTTTSPHAINPHASSGPSPNPHHISNQSHTTTTLKPYPFQHYPNL